MSDEIDEIGARMGLGWFTCRMYFDYVDFNFTVHKLEKNAVCERCYSMIKNNKAAVKQLLERTVTGSKSIRYDLGKIDHDRIVLMADELLKYV